MTLEKCHFLYVIPAKAGISGHELDSRIRGNDFPEVA